jgi:hypothetical protein
MAKLLAVAFKAVGGAWQAIVGLFKWGMAVMSEADGTPSWARCGSAAIVTCWCLVFVRTQAVPDRTADVAFLIAALYGANQLKDAVVKYSEMRAAPEQPKV